MTAQQAAIVAAARLWIGTPYRHQASARGAGADCLGLLRGVWRDVRGAEPEPIPPYAPGWCLAAPEEPLWSALRRHFLERDLAVAASGDVLLFRLRERGAAWHVGLQAQIGARASVIHAYSSHGVVESPLSRPWARRLVARFAFPPG